MEKGIDTELELPLPCAVPVPASLIGAKSLFTNRKKSKIVG